MDQKTQFSQISQTFSHESAKLLSSNSQWRWHILYSDVTVEDEEVFLTSCDLTTPNVSAMVSLKGCILKNSSIAEEYDNDECLNQGNMSFWRKYFCCQLCLENWDNSVWVLAVRCAKFAPEACYYNRFCILLDKVRLNQTFRKQWHWSRMKWSEIFQKLIVVYIVIF
jgi:hypothetical protein